MNNLWKWITGAFALLLAAFLYEKDQKENAEAKLDNADTNAKDKSLEQHTEDLKTELTQEQAEAEKLKNEPTSQEDLLKFLNKDKS